MKRILFALMAIAATISCEKAAVDEPATTERKDIVLTRAEQEILTSGGEFSFNLLKEMYKSDEQLFMSPLSAQAALMMVANGASGETYEQIVKTIGYEKYSTEELNSMYRKIVEGLTEVDTSTDFEMANSIWTAKGMDVNKTFQELLEENYNAESGDVDFHSQSEIDRINKWCDDKTHGMVPSIIDGPNGNLKLLILNALYFKGQWSHKFDKNNTSKGTFKSLSGEEVQLDFMRQTEKFSYSVNEEFQLCSLPFGNKGFCMDILLPCNNVDFIDFINHLDYKKFSVNLGMLQTSELMLSIPKLKFDYECQLSDVLKKMGMSMPFSPEADFCNINNKEDLTISEVKQKAAFEMDEEGAKAAAVTSVGMTNGVGPAPSVIFFADRPFVFTIRETSTNAILFLGTYTGEK